MAASSSFSLTPGAIGRLQNLNGHSSDPAFLPTVQVTNLKPVNAQGERFRVILSDGVHSIQGMLATQLNELVRSQQLHDNTVIQVHDFMNNKVKGRSIIILLKIQVLDNPGHKIGTPVDIARAAATASATASTSPAVAATPDRPQPMYNRTNKDMHQQQYQSFNKPATNTTTNPYGRPSPPRDNSAVVPAPIVRSVPSTTQTNITPIAQLNMYQNRWTIRARLTSKSDIRSWSNAKGEGTLFSIELLDASMDIRATFFREAVDKFYNFLQVGKVYTFSGGRLKVANMQYNTCKSSFEITFDQNSEIHLDNDTGDIVKQQYDFTKIGNMDQVDPGKTVDLLAVVKQVDPPVTIVSKKSGNEMLKCELLLVDDSSAEIRLTLWGESAAKAPNEYIPNQSVIAVRRARVSDYGGRTLSGGTIDARPELPEAATLLQWYQQGAHTTRSLSGTVGRGGKMDRLADRKPLSAIKHESLGHNDKPDYLSFKAHFSFIKKDKEGGAWYPACPNEGDPCKNMFKVTQTTDGNWFCDKCQGTFPDSLKRWIFSGTVIDDSSTSWVSIFNEQAETLLDGAKAQDICREVEGGNQDAYDSLFARATNTEWIFRAKVKNEMVNDEARVKTSLMALYPVDYVQESRDLLAAIEAFS